MTHEVVIKIDFALLSKSVIMNILVPDSRDEEEYIDEFLDSILTEEHRYSVEWDFFKG